MERPDRTVLEFGSMDMGLDELKIFRESALKASGLDSTPMELVVNSGLSGVEHYDGLEELLERYRVHMFKPSYFHYSITWPSVARCSLYLEPDRPARIVMEGGSDVLERMKRTFTSKLGTGGKRYRLHGPVGLFLIWLVVILIASTFILAFIIGSGSADPVIIIPVIVSSSVLGMYLSMFKLKDLNPANTVSLGPRGGWIGNVILNMLTVALGIISAIIAAFILRSALG
ncbi:MAG: hypothetical protein QCI82_05575 [Candidatus Thermoplasmatota archaeon]|nr:hypothetical protein [Candidatus Thermoplasmatota archaeon]